MDALLIRQYNLIQCFSSTQQGQPASNVTTVGEGEREGAEAFELSTSLYLSLDF